jgi:hypothetical protein
MAKSMQIPQIQVQVNKIYDSWILITYDLNRKSRGKFRDAIKSLGAMRHTDSVYYLPHSEEAFTAVKQAMGGGEIFVWASKLDKPTAETFTKKFAQDLQWLLNDINLQLTEAEKAIEEMDKSDEASVKKAARRLKGARVLITQADAAFTRAGLDKEATEFKAYGALFKVLLDSFKRRSGKEEKEGKAE